MNAKYLRKSVIYLTFVFLLSCFTNVTLSQQSSNIRGYDSKYPILDSNAADLYFLFSKEGLLQNVEASYNTPLELAEYKKTLAFKKSMDSVNRLTAIAKRDIYIFELHDLNWSNFQMDNKIFIITVKDHMMRYNLFDGLVCIDSLENVNARAFNLSNKIKQQLQERPINEYDNLLKGFSSSVEDLCDPIYALAIYVPNSIDALKLERAKKNGNLEIAILSSPVEATSKEPNIYERSYCENAHKYHEELKMTAKKLIIYDSQTGEIIYTFNAVKKGHVDL